MDHINRVSGALMVGLALVALLVIAVGYAQPPAPPPPDENTGAHIFQFSIAALLPVGLVFLGTADWSRPRRNAVLLALAGLAVALAFAGLYYGEHVLRRF